MMKRIRIIFKWILLVCGGVALLASLLVVGYLAYELGFGNRNKVDSASVKDPRFVLNRCQLGDKRIKKVVHSYVSSRSMTGDHLDAYAIKITHLSPKELVLSEDAMHDHWYRGDKLPPLLSDAVDFTGNWLDEVPWFPKENILRTQDYYVYPVRIVIYGVRPTAVDIIFAKPSDRMVFYFSGKT
jgi:hypothetical protein